MRLAVLTISDAGARGERPDTSGDAIVVWAAARGDLLVERHLVPDETGDIVATLLRWCDSGEVELVLTTGGTGLSPRDVTPEATAVVIERSAPGIAERIRAQGAANTPHAALSRGLAGTRGQTLIINFPGSTRAVHDALTAIDPLIDHAVKILRGQPTDHRPEPTA
jgi:molybdenum cofactor synthesis domain-containing protein